MVVGELVLLAASTPEPSQGRRLGLTVSRKVGNAVARNHVKRRVREWFRTHRSRLAPGTDVVVIGRRGAAELSGREIAERLDRAVDRLGAAR